MVTVIPRSEWGARHDDGGGSAPVPFTEWWLHHSVTVAPDLVPPFDDEHRAMRTLEDIGEQRFGQGISYTWPIMPNGRVYQGHSVNRLGAHTGGRNSAARAICLVGNYDVSRVTPQQIESAAQLMVQEYRAGRATRYMLNGGHQQLKATSCPGKYGMEAIPLINARATALMHGAPPMEDDDMPYTQKQIEDFVYGAVRNLFLDMHNGDNDAAKRVFTSLVAGAVTAPTVDWTKEGGEVISVAQQTANNAKAIAALAAKVDALGSGTSAGAKLPTEFDLSAMARAVADEMDRRARDGDAATGPTT